MAAKSGFGQKLALELILKLERSETFFSKLNLSSILASLKSILKRFTFFREDKDIIQALQDHGVLSFRILREGRS